MKLRSQLVVATAVAIVAGGCASASTVEGASTSGAAAAVMTQGSRPQEGKKPSDNMYTRSAELYLTQAQQNADPEVKRTRFGEALGSSLQAVASDPGNPRGYFQAGRAYIGAADWAGADTMLTKALEMWPDYAEDVRLYREGAWVGLYNAAIGLGQGDDLEAAIEGMQRANTIFRGRPEAMLNLGSLYSRTEQPDKAIEAYAMALQALRDNIDTQPERAQETWRSNEEIAAFNLAQLYATNDRSEEAVQAYEEFLEAHPDNVTAKSNLAVVLLQMERSEEAMAIYSEILDRTDLTARDYFAAGIGLFNGQRFPEAARAFGMATEINPSSRDAAYNQAQTLFLAENWEELREATPRLLELDPNSPNAFRLAAQGLLNTGEEDAAIALMERMSELPFEVIRTTMRPAPGGGSNLTGEATNKNLEAGTGVLLRFHFTDVEGTEVGTTEVPVTLAEVDVVVPFETFFAVEGGSVFGYWYEVVGQ